MSNLKSSRFCCCCVVVFLGGGVSGSTVLKVDPNILWLPPFVGTFESEKCMSYDSGGVNRLGPVCLPFSLGAASLFDVGLFTTFSRASSRCTGVAVFGRPWLSDFSGVVLICFRHSRSSVTGYIAHKTGRLAQAGQCSRQFFTQCHGLGNW